MGLTNRILSYNVRYFSHSVRGLFSTQHSVVKIAAAIAKLNPPANILCMQEVRTALQLDAFAQALMRASGRRYHALHFPAHVTSLYRTGLGILIDAQQLSVAAQTLHVLTSGSDPGERRICAHVELHADAHTFHVFNAHLSLPSPFLVTKLGHGANQLAQASRLNEFVRTRSHGQPFIVCGDFNAQPTSPVAHRFDDLAAVPATFTAGVGPWRMRLDYLMSGNGLTWLDADGTHSFGEKTGLFHGLSDHVPLIARFSL